MPLLKPEAERITSQLAVVLEKPLVVVDVGCRDGFDASWTNLRHAGHLIGFEPDPPECERLAKQYAKHPGVEVVPVALGARDGTEQLMVTRDPYGSSLYGTNPRIIRDYPVLVDAEVVASEPVDVRSLDSWCAERGLDHVDAIKLDTQGSELDILMGGERILRTVRTIKTEVQFADAYVSGPLFADVDRYLRSHGFVLWVLRTLGHCAPRGAPDREIGGDMQAFDHHGVGFAVRPGRLFWADAYYVRAELEDLESERSAPELVADAAAAAGFGLVDLAWVLLQRAQALGGSLADVLATIVPPAGAAGENLDPTGTPS